MGISLKIFVVRDDNSLERLPTALYERLMKNNKSEKVLKYAGKNVKSAFCYIEMESRKPVSIIRIDYAILYFDSLGYLDTEKIENALSLVAEITGGFLETWNSEKIINSQNHFAKVRYKNEYKWKPTSEIEKAIVDAMFTPKKKSRFHLIKGKEK
jgi:hypothetical protein